MSPPKPHIPPNAKGTTVRLTAEDHEAIHEISKAREGGSDETKRTKTRKNDILLDGLWDLLRKETGKTREDIRAHLPAALRTPEPPPPINKVAEMPKKKH